MEYLSFANISAKSCLWNNIYNLVLSQNILSKMIIFNCFI